MIDLDPQTSNIRETAWQKGRWKSMRASSEGFSWWMNKEELNLFVFLNQLLLPCAFPYYFVWILRANNLLSTWWNNTFSEKKNCTTELNWLSSSIKEYQYIWSNIENITFTECLYPLKRLYQQRIIPLMLSFPHEVPSKLILV